MTKKKATKKKETWEVWEKKVMELCDILKNEPIGVFYKSTAAQFACFQIVNQAAYSHYEALGILEEAKLEYRELSLNALNEEDSSN
jgi:hypothetical protein